MTGHGWTVAPVRMNDLEPLAALMRDYCAFYGTDTTKEALSALASALLQDPKQGEQFLGSDGDGVPRGFATLYWTWSTTRAGRIGVMNDLYVAPGARSSGLGRALLAACAERCRAAGVIHMEWRTAPGNATAQRLYDGLGAERVPWLVYKLPVPGPPPP